MPLGLDPVDFEIFLEFPLRKLPPDIPPIESRVVDVDSILIRAFSSSGGKVGVVYDEFEDAIEARFRIIWPSSLFPSDGKVTESLEGNPASGREVGESDRGCEEEEDERARRDDRDGGSS